MSVSGVCGLTLRWGRDARPADVSQVLHTVLCNVSAVAAGEI